MDKQEKEITGWSLIGIIIVTILVYEVFWDDNYDYTSCVDDCVYDLSSCLDYPYYSSNTCIPESDVAECSDDLESCMSDCEYDYGD